MALQKIQYSQKSDFQIPSYWKYDHFWKPQKSLWISGFEVMAPQMILYSWKHDNFEKSLKSLGIQEIEVKPPLKIACFQSLGLGLEQKLDLGLEPGQKCGLGLKLGQNLGQHRARVVVN